MIKAIVFDCFGVFVSDTYNERFAYIWDKSPEEVQQIQDIRRAADRGFLTQSEAFSHLAPLFGMSEQQLAEEQRLGEVLNERLVKFLKELKPHYKIALLSNVSGSSHLRQVFAPYDLNELFDVVVASGDIGIAKPDIEIYQKTANLLGVDPEECVMLDDNELFCRGAEDSGMRAVQYLSYEQAVSDIKLLFDRGEERV